MWIRSRLLEAVAPEKDVDGFHPVNAGRLLSGFPLEDILAPCTPAGIMEILRRSNIPIRGKHAVVMGRSNIVGKPAAAMLINASATVTVCHSQTADLGAITREADIVVAAIGKAGVCDGGDGEAGRDDDRCGDESRLTTEAEVAAILPGQCDEARGV